MLCSLRSPLIRVPSSRWRAVGLVPVTTTAPHRERGQPPSALQAVAWSVGNAEASGFRPSACANDKDGYPALATAARAARGGDRDAPGSRLGAAQGGAAQGDPGAGRSGLG